MINKNNFFKNFLLHIKYPYTALIITIMWLGITLTIWLQGETHADLLIILTAILSIVIALIGFSSPKK